MFSVAPPDSIQEVLASWPTFWTKLADERARAGFSLSKNINRYIVRWVPSEVKITSTYYRRRMVSILLAEVEAGRLSESAYTLKMDHTWKTARAKYHLTKEVREKLLYEE